MRIAKNNKQSKKQRRLKKNQKNQKNQKKPSPRTLRTPNLNSPLKNLWTKLTLTNCDSIGYNSVFYMSRVVRVNKDAS